MRIRTIKPDFWADEFMAKLPMAARLVYIALWNEADDEGRLRGNHRYLKSVLFPYDDDLNMKAILDSLKAHGKVIEYSVRHQTYLFLPNFLRHQRINRPTPSKLPKHEENQVVPTHSVSNHGGLMCDSLQERKGRERTNVRVEATPTKKSLRKNLDVELTAAVACASVEFLNQLAKRKYASNADSTHKLIRQLIRKQHTLEEIKLVIESKCREWNQDPEKKKYLRPSTLFNGTNFDKYLENALEEGRRARPALQSSETGAWSSDGEPLEKRKVAEGVSLAEFEDYIS